MKQLGGGMKRFVVIVGVVCVLGTGLLLGFWYGKQASAKNLKQSGLNKITHLG